MPRNHGLSHRSAQTLSRVIGLLILLSIAAGAFGESYVPSRLIASSDAAATARNVIEHDALFRWGFAIYLAEALCDVALAVLFYALLRPVSKTIALVSAFFGLISAAMYAVAESFYFAPGLLLSGAAYLKAFTPEQIDALVLLSFKLFSRIAGLFLIFYGAGVILRGYLIAQSGFLPKTLGVLFVLGGLGFVVRTATLVLAPSMSSAMLLLPMAVAGIALMLWLLVKGVDAEGWANATESRAES